MKSQKKALTLAEILIVIAIIAIIATIVLPGLYKKVKKQAGIATVSRTKYAIELGCQQTLDEYNDPANGRAYNVNKVLLTNIWSTKILKYAGAANSTGSTTLGNNKVFQMQKFKSTITSTNVNNSDTGIYDDTTAVFRAKIAPNSSTTYLFDLQNDCNMVPADSTTKNLVKSGFKAN